MHQRKISTRDFYSYSISILARARDNARIPMRHKDLNGVVIFPKSNKIEPSLRYPGTGESEAASTEEKLMHR